MERLDFPILHENSVTNLELNITTADVIKAIERGKTLGPDSIPIEIFKIFKDKLVQLLLDINQESFNCRTLPPSLNVVTIPLILKPNEPATHVVHIGLTVKL